MGWKMTLYAETGAELGWVTADPYDYHLTDAVEDRAEAERWIRENDLTTERAGGSFRRVEDGEVEIGAVDGEFKITDWEQHLSELGSYLVYRDLAGSYSVEGPEE